MLNEIFKKVDDNRPLERGDLSYILNITDEQELEELFAKAYEIKKRYIGKVVSLRGIIEFSNICSKDCYYCGIRKSNSKVRRFQMALDEIYAEAEWAWQQNYGSVVLQSGERSDDEFVDFVAEALAGIKKLSNGELGITISLGEQTLETYRRWREAGAHRYLLRIESSNKELYDSLHPDSHDFERRKECIKFLQQAGFQTGTGVLIGFPGQTPDDLVNDLLFFKELDIDMIGMGPYLAHPETPLAVKMPEFEEYRSRQLKLGLKMIAAARLLLRDINIASTTALQALDSRGRELGLLAGGNVIMPNVTDTKFRPSYKLYEHKPGVNENSEESRDALEKSIANIGETICYGSWGDSAHYFARTKEKK